MDYAFEFEQVVSIISAPFTVNEQFCLGELLLCSIRQEREKKENPSNLLTLGVCRDDNVTSVWRGGAHFLLVVYHFREYMLLPLLPQISSSPSHSPKLCPPSAPLIHHFFILFTRQHLLLTQSFSLYAPSSVCLLSTLYTWFLYHHPSTSTSFICSSSTFSLFLSCSLLFLWVCLSLHSAVSLLYAWADSWRGALKVVTSRASRTAVFVY